MTLVLTGHPVQAGISVGQAHIVQLNELEIGEFRIPAEAVAAEIERLEQALQGAREHLQELVGRLQSTAGSAAEEVIRTHITMLADATLMDTAADLIRSQHCNAEWALQLLLEEWLTQFRQIDDEYIRARAEDVVQVVRMVQQTLSSNQPGRALLGVPDRLGHTVVIAAELTPGELAVLHERGVAGVITEHGSPHSHTAILARGMGIPTVMGVHRAQVLVQEGEQLILDGHYGVVFAGPAESTLRHYLQKQSESQRFQKSLEGIRKRQCASLDGSPVCLLANSERPESMRTALLDGAEGVGLYRSEFLFLQGSAPDEATQLRHYTEALEALDGAPLTIRTMDLGADKTFDLLDFSALAKSPNPALGLRAVRLCLRETELFTTQLRAILRASALGRVRCLIPMLTSAREVATVRSMLDDARHSLRQAGIPFDEHMPLGGMIEVPGAALALQSVARQLDFISVGTNDLIQYALAADRVDEHVAHVYDPLHPGVLALLASVFENAQRQNLPVAVCGEMAGDRRYTRLLLALGLREFSMQPRNLLGVKQVITETDIGRVRTAWEAWRDGQADSETVSLLQYLDQSQNAAAAAETDAG